jgi:AcrR family transcriptional regulator
MARVKDSALEERRRAEVIAAAYGLLCETSVATVTFDRVAERAGVSKGLVTYYFPSKDDLVIATIRHYHALQRTLLAAIAKGEEPAVTLLERLVEAGFPDRASVESELFFQVEVWSFAKDRPAVRRAVAESYRSFRRACQALLDRGVGEGYVTTREADWAYLFVHALVDGLSFQIAVDPDLDLAALRRRVTRLFEALLQGAADVPARRQRPRRSKRRARE